MAGICSHLEELSCHGSLEYLFIAQKLTIEGKLNKLQHTHFPEYYPTLQSISHLTNRGRAWVRKNLEMMIVVVVRSLQSSSVGLCIIIHTIQYYVWGVFWAAYLLQIKSEIANKKFILGSQRSHQLCSTHLCPEMRIWRHGTQLGIYTAVSSMRGYDVWHAGNCNALWKTFILGAVLQFCGHLGTF